MKAETKKVKKIHQYHITDGPYYARITAESEEAALAIYYQHNRKTKYPVHVSIAW